jgi:sugar lactone lactonase YvrE
MTEATISRWELYERAVPVTDPAWRLDTLVAPARHYATNGIRLGRDGRLWIAQVLGRHLTSLDVHDGSQRVEVPLGAGLCGPDDLAFDDHGNTYCTEPHDGRVTRVSSTGAVDVWADGLPGANGITVSADGRLFIDECRPGGRLIEVDVPEPGRWRVVTDGLGMPNALHMAADGWLHLPEVSANRVLAVDPATGAQRVAVADVHAPSAVKCDARGRIHVTEAGSGRVTRVDPSTGERRTVAALEPGLDNLAIAADGTIYVSSFVTGSIRRIAPANGAVTDISPPGLLTVDTVSVASDGRIIVSDRMSVVAINADRALDRLACVPVDMQFAITGAAIVDDVLFVVAVDGRLLRRTNGQAGFRPLEDLPAGVTAVAPEDGRDPRVHVAVRGDAIAVDPGGGVRRTQATGLACVTALAAHGGAIAACDRADGTVVVLGTTTETWTGFRDPSALALTAEAVFVAECAARQVVRVDRATGQRTVVARDMPFGAPVRGHDNGVGPPSLCAQEDGAVLVGCSGDASVRRLAPARS